MSLQSDEHQQMHSLVCVCLRLRFACSLMSHNLGFAHSDVWHVGEIYIGQMYALSSLLTYLQSCYFIFFITGFVLVLFQFIPMYTIWLYMHLNLVTFCHHCSKCILHVYQRVLFFVHFVVAQMDRSVVELALYLSLSSPRKCVTVLTTSGHT